MILVDFSKANNRDAVLGLGYFDCLHIGHRKLLEEVKSMAKAKGVAGSVFTFSNNPGKLLKNKNRLVNTFDERLDLFENFGMDMVFYAEFDKQFMSMEAEVFLQKLKEKHVVGVVCGFDYTFGSRSVGTVKMLSEFCALNGIAFKMVDKVDFCGQKASATLIKDLLTKGEIEKANACLGHDYFLSGIVCHGFGIGADRVYPTANVTVDEDKLLPKLGVYAGRAEIGGETYRCVVNIGGRPTFDDGGAVKAETYLLDYNGDIYGKKITVFLKKYIREIKKFDSAEALKEQITKDIETAKNV